jgi:membrane protein involved in colicin uptake
VLLGWLLAGEHVTLNVLMAGAMVIGAVVLVDRGTARLQRERLRRRRQSACDAEKAAAKTAAVRKLLWRG